MVEKAQKISVAGKQEGAKHSYSTEEVSSFCEHINFYLGDDPDLKDLLSVNPESNHVFTILEDEIFIMVNITIVISFSKMINKAQENTIDLRAINMKKPVNVFKRNENLNLAISSARSIGCIIVNIHPEEIAKGTHHIVLGFLWQIIKVQALSNIDLKHHPYLIRLKEENEELEDLLKLPKEQLLLRWFNYHLKNAQHPRKVNNFDKDLMDDGRRKLCCITQSNCPEKCDKSGLQVEGVERATKIISDTRKLDVPPCIKPSDITSGQPRLNLLHCAHIFNNCPGLTATEEEKLNAAELIDDDNDPEASREERVFRMWMNCMGIEDLYINNLIQDLRDGLVLGKVLNKLKPGIVGPKDMSDKASRIYKIQNCNKAVEVASQSLGCKIVGIGGVDIVDGKKKLILAIVWQLMKIDSLNIVGGLKEEELIAWANSRVDQAVQVKNLKDKSLANCQFFFILLASIEPQLINWEFVNGATNEEEVMNNAKYIISVARKLGCSVFLVWEHLRDVNQKFLMTFIASIKSAAENYKKNKLKQEEEQKQE